MDKLRLRNYRCFEDTGDVELKPITLLLGANSSGKSSFIKFFPLLQQSLETRINGLFLWDGQYVDFKSFKNTVKDGEGQIVIDYTIGELTFNSSYKADKVKLKDVVVTMTLNEKEDYYDYLKELTIRFEGVCVKYNFSSDGRKCSIDANGVKSSAFGDEKVKYENDNNLLPYVSFVNVGKNYTISSIFSRKAQEELDPYLKHAKKSELELLLGIDEGLVPFDYQRIKEMVRSSSKKNSNEIVDKVFNLQLYFYSGCLVKSVNEYFAMMSRKFSYVLPLRAIMNRYYRFQNRNVDTIDPDGDNLSMFLNSLSESKLEEFNHWLNDIFKFKLDVNKSEGHVELIIEEKDKPKRNLVDVGFGYTQILPILSIIWKSVYGSSGNIEIFGVKKVPITIAIEQPELHLHPRFQAYFAMMLAKVVGYCKSKKVAIRLIIETHSEVIVNKLGQLICDSTEGIDKDDVNVVLFDAKDEGLEKYVHTTGYSEDGGLINWPFGFFADDVY